MSRGAEPPPPGQHEHRHQRRRCRCWSAAAQGSGWSATKVASVSAYSFAFFVFGLQVNLLGPTASVLAARAGVTEPDLGVIFSVNGLLSIVGAVPSGWLVDRLPGHAVLAAALAVEALGFALIPALAGSLPSLVLAFGTAALSWNVINTGGNTLVLWIGNARGDPSAQGFLINGVNALFGAGSLAAPLLAELCDSALGAPLSVYWLSAGLTAASAAGFLLLPSPERPGGGGGGAAEAEAGEREAEEAEAAGDHWWGGGPLSLLLLIIALFNFLNVGTEVAFGGWIFTYAVRQAGLSPHEGHLLNAAYWLSFTFGRVAASFGAVALPPQALLYSSLPLAAAGAALALAAPPALLSGGPGLLLAACALIGVGVSPGFANSLALLDRYQPCTGAVTGLLGGVAGAGCMSLPLAIALIAKGTRWGYQGLMLCALASFAVQLGCVPAAQAAGGCVLARRGAAAAAGARSVTKELLPDEREALLAAEAGGASSEGEC